MTEDKTIGELLDDLSRRVETLSNSLAVYQEKVRNIMADSSGESHLLLGTVRKQREMK